MARLPYLEKSQVAAEHQDLMDRDITLYKQLVHSPGALRAFRGLGGYIRFKSPLDARLRELAILQVGYLARAEYEWSHHIKLGYTFGVTDADIEALIADTEGRPAQLERRTQSGVGRRVDFEYDGEMSAATFTALSAHLPNEHLVDLIMTVAFYNGVVRVLGSLQIDVEPDYQPYLARYPLPPKSARRESHRSCR